MNIAALRELKRGDKVLVTRPTSMPYNGQTGEVVRVWSTWASVRMDDGSHRPFGAGDLERLDTDEA